MCTSQITLRKFLKLLLQIYLYKLLLFPLFLLSGYETFSITRFVKLIMPFWGIKSDFVGCFLIFYITIPFWNILVRNMTQKTHRFLVLLLLMCYTLLGSVPTFHVSFNYVTWFGIIYLIASYIRLYPNVIFEKRFLWGWLTLVFMIGAIISVLVLHSLFSERGYFVVNHFVVDSNKIFPVLVAVSSFLWFKNLNIKYSKVINAFGAATFGVLLIHANSNAMRTWLWRDVVDCVGHATMPLGGLVVYSVGVVLAVFLVCNFIDQLRIATIEKIFFRWYDKNLSNRLDSIVDELVNSKQ